MARGCFPVKYRETYNLLAEQDADAYATGAPHSAQVTWFAALNAPGTWPGWI